MTDKEILYEALGELLYIVAKADGIIQNEEIQKLREILKDHPFEKEINWSFDYEVNKSRDLEDVYKKVIIACDKIGPSPIYNEFISSMELIAQASEGIQRGEALVMSSFPKDLIERFKADIEKYY